MQGNISIFRQRINCKQQSINKDSWPIAILLLVIILASASISIIYASPLPFFMALALLLIIPTVLIIFFNITPIALLSLYVFSRVLLDSIHEITYKGVIGSLSIMKLYSFSIIAFGLLYLVYKKEIKTDWLFVSLLAILSALLATTIYHQTWVEFVESAMKWTYLWLIISLVRLSLDKRSFYRFSIILLASYAYSMLNFLYSLASGKLKCTGTGSGIDEVCRFIGTYSHQSGFSFIMLAIIPVSLYLMIVEKEIIKKSLYAMVLLLAHLGIYTASYRTTWIALALYWIIFFGLFMKEVPASKKALLIFSATIVVGIFMIPGSYLNNKIGERLAPLTNVLHEPSKYFGLSSSAAYEAVTGHPYVDETKENLSLSGRVGDWRALIIGYSNSPVEEKILGLGVGKDKEIMARYKWGEAYDAHNIYIETLVETGILGLGALLIFIFSTCFRLISRVTQQSLPTIVAIPIFFSYIVAGLSSNILDDIRMSLCLGLYLGAALYYQGPGVNIGKKES